MYQRLLSRRSKNFVANTNKFNVCSFKQATSIKALTMQPSIIFVEFVHLANSCPPEAVIACTVDNWQNKLYEKLRG